MNNLYKFQKIFIPKFMNLLKIDVSFGKRWIYEIIKLILLIE